MLRLFVFLSLLLFRHTYVYKMTLNTQKERKEPLRRRASTPIPSSRQGGKGERDPSADPYHPPLAQSASYHPGDKSIHSQANWSSDSESDSSGAECLYRVVLLGDHGVGKSSLANIFAGIQEKDAHKHIGGTKSKIYYGFCGYLFMSTFYISWVDSVDSFCSVQSTECYCLTVNIALIHYCKNAWHCKA